MLRTTAKGVDTLGEGRMKTPTTDVEHGGLIVLENITHKVGSKTLLLEFSLISLNWDKLATNLHGGGAMSVIISPR